LDDVEPRLGQSGCDAQPFDEVVVALVLRSVGRFRAARGERDPVGVDATTIAITTPTTPNPIRRSNAIATSATRTTKNARIRKVLRLFFEICSYKSCR
jgi:hypothetical protein